MASDIVHLEESATEEEVLDTVRRLTEDENVHGILVQVPLPKQVDENKVLEAIAPEKDVDGFSPINIGRLYPGQETFIPCTPLGSMELLQQYGSLAGRVVAVIGRRSTA